MLKSLHVKNFTVFEDAKFDFGPGLNVIVGANGTGKSHVLKLGYAVMQARYKLGLPFTAVAALGRVTFSKADWQRVLADNLMGVFRPEGIGRLARRRKSGGHNRTEVKLEFERSKASIEFSFSTRSQTDVALEKIPEGKFESVAPVFIPTKELLSLFPGLPSLYNAYALSIDQTYPDLCERLATPLLNGPKLTQVRDLLKPLEGMIHGTVKNQGGRFYLLVEDIGRLEIELVAEGIRKLATLAYLLNNGSLKATTTLFWDEPEANLNPQLLVKLAEILALLARQGFQIVLATHSLFLLKQLHILSRESPTPLNYFSLVGDQFGEPTQVETADELPMLPGIVALEAEMEQADTFLDVLNKDDEDV